MTVEKIYRSLTKGEIGVYVSSEVDKTDGRITHILNIRHEDGTTEERHIADSTFKRWWKLVEETTPEDMEESVEQLNKLKDTVTKEQPTIEDLKQLNESGEELTEEELEMFKHQSQEQIQKEAETTEAVLELQKEDTTAEQVIKEKAKRQLKPNEHNDLAKYFEQAAVNKGCEIKYYSEPNKRAIKYNGKNVFFYYVYSANKVGIVYKYEIDELLIPEEIKVMEAPKYDNPYKFKVMLEGNSEETKHFIDALVDSLV